MSSVVTTSSVADRFGIALSTLCLVHCLVLPVFSTGAALWIASEAVHFWMVGILVPVVLLAAGSGYRSHGNPLVSLVFYYGTGIVVATLLFEASLPPGAEVLFTTIGSLILMAAHGMNWRLQRCQH